MALLHSVSSHYVELIEAWKDSSTHTIPVWQPPPRGSWKINFNVAIHKSFAFATAICRDSDGHILSVFKKRLPPSGPPVGEARAALLATQEAFFLPMKRITLEGDSLLVIDAINNRANGAPWQISSVIAAIHRLSSSRDLWEFCHVKCEANDLAHQVVQWAASANLEGHIPISYIPMNILPSNNPWFPP